MANTRFAPTFVAFVLFVVYFFINRKEHER